MVSLIHHFKYKNYDYLAGLLSSFMAEHLIKIGFEPGRYHFVAAVPLHKDKLKTRGYNQSGLLAKLLSNYFKIPFRDDIIANVNARPSQTQLPKEKRKKNVKDIFVAKETVINKRIILIDDIFTTGSTAKACSKALKERGAQYITVITLAKTVSLSNYADSKKLYH
jgi:ComF family protein